MDVEGVIAELGTRFDADEAAIAERMLREYGGTVADGQLISFELNHGGNEWSLTELRSGQDSLPQRRQLFWVRELTSVIDNG